MLSFKKRIIETPSLTQRSFIQYKYYYFNQVLPFIVASLFSLLSNEDFELVVGIVVDAFFCCDQV